jgi:hypothetical protein
MRPKPVEEFLGLLWRSSGNGLCSSLLMYEGTRRLDFKLSTEKTCTGLVDCSVRSLASHNWLLQITEIIASSRLSQANGTTQSKTVVMAVSQADAKPAPIEVRTQIHHTEHLHAVGRDGVFFPHHAKELRLRLSRVVVPLPAARRPMTPDGLVEAPGN